MDSKSDLILALVKKGKKDKEESKDSFLSLLTKPKEKPIAASTATRD